MPLSLTAEQKDLKAIFDIQAQYVIPAYQRPYSWEYDQSFQLYNDIIEQFENKTEYFVGNIILARSETNKESLEVIDGQQRLTTFLLIFKVLSIIHPEIDNLHRILEKKDLIDNTSDPRIISRIFEAKDQDDLEYVLKYTKEIIDARLATCLDKNNHIIERKCFSRFEANLLHFYNWFLFYFEREIDSSKKIIRFLLSNVYLLPIELTGKTIEDANEKALDIFETINNRGMNLEDADIFKAQLYRKARNINKHDEFIKYWIDFKASCERLNLSIDDIFRYYSHIIRGNRGITSGETSLREFFMRKKYSPFESEGYEKIMEDLFRIVEIIDTIQNKTYKKLELSKWLQLIDFYTNQYPRYALVTYLFINPNYEEDELIRVLKSIVRYTYFQGSTTTVKFEIYNIIKRICLRAKVDSYFKETNSDYFNYLGRLKYGYPLLAYYSNEKNETIESPSVDRIVTWKDIVSDNNDWDEDSINSLGNFIVLDIDKRNVSLSRKLELYKSSQISEVKEISKGFGYKQYLKRDNKLKEMLINFFKGESFE